MSENILNVGFGRVDMTPDYSVPLAGYGNTMTRMSKGCLDGLFATCIAITDDRDETVLIITTDACATFTFMVQPLHEAVTAATGVPSDHIIVSATHTHSAPDLKSEYDNNMSSWKRDYVGAVASAAAAAMADRAPAKVLLGDTHTENLNFVRHFLLENGTYAGDNFGDFKSAPIADYATPADTQLQMIRFVRQDCKDILMVNWQAHPKLASTASTADGRATRPWMSADFIAPCRDYVEEQAGVLFAYYQGAAGNMNPNTRIEAHTRATEYRAHGKLLGEVIVNGLDGLKESAVPACVQARRTVFNAPVDHTEDCMVEDARRIFDLWSQTNDYRKCAEEGQPCGIMSPYHAEGILRRFNATETYRELTLTALSIGPVGFVGAPYEMFDTNGKFIKDNSPFPTTFVISYTNGQNGYVASEKAFEYGSYEVHNRDFARGAAEELASTMLGMLKDMNR